MEIIPRCRAVFKHLSLVPSRAFEETREVRTRISKLDTESDEMCLCCPLARGTCFKLHADYGAGQSGTSTENRR